MALNGIDSMKRNLVAMSDALQGIAVNWSEENELENSEAGITADSPSNIIPMDIGDASTEAIEQNLDVIPDGSSIPFFTHVSYEFKKKRIF